MLEGDGFEPVDADMDAVGIVAARNLEILAARGAGAHEYRVELAAVEHLLQAVDAVVEFQIDAHVQYVADLLIEHLGRQAKARNVGAHQPARCIQSFENRDFITERCEIVCNR